MTYYNFNPFQLEEEQRLGWVAVQNQIAYRQPALPLEKVIIDSTLLRLGERNLLIEMRMWDHSQQHLKSLLWMTLVHYNLRTQKSQVHNEKLRTFLASIENPLPQPVSFGERTKQLSTPTVVNL